VKETLSTVIRLMKKKILIFVLVFIFLVSGGYAYYIFLTPGGAEFVSRIYLPRFGLERDLLHNKITGNFLQGLSVKNLKIANFKGLLQKNILRIQEIRLVLRPFSINDARCSIHNGRIELSTRETIQFYGSYDREKLDFNIYSNSLSLRTLAQVFPKIRQLQLAGGKIENLEVFVNGSFPELQLKGSCNLKDVKIRNLVLENAPCSYSLRPKIMRDKTELRGEVNVSGGSLRSRSTTVKIEESKAIFAGDPQMPIFNINGSALIGETNIHILLKGNPSKPELILSSVPALPQERLLVMLFTGKTWESMDKAASERRLTVDMVNDFVDYFFLGGSGQKLGQKLGIESISLEFEPNEKGVEVKKSLIGSTSAIYGVKQTQKPLENPLTTQKVGMEYKVTDNFSIEGIREIEQPTDKGLIPKIPKDEIRLKYKNNF